MSHNQIVLAVSVLAVLIYRKLFHYLQLSKMSLKKNMIFFLNTLD